MHPATMMVLGKLRNKKRRGITVDDFAIGFRLAARVFELREMRHVIHAEKEKIATGTRARYVLIKEGKQYDASA